MSTFFLACALLGGGVVLLQLAATLLGLDHGGPHDAHAPHDAAQGLHLTSLRALSAGLAFFGLTGYGLLRGGWGIPAVLGLSAAAGVAALVVVAVLLRLMLRLESDGTVRIENAVWQP